MGLFSSKPAAPPVATLSVNPSPSVLKPSSTPSRWSTVSIMLGIALLFILGVLLYNYFRKRAGLPGVFMGDGSASADLAPSVSDGKTRSVLPAATAPTGVSDYGMQFWMYIADWDYKFGQEKHVVKRVSSANTAMENPRITLHPTDNSLNVRVSLYPNGETTAAGAAAPTSSSTADSFTCTVENVPLQAWFSVSTTVFQRNLDIYINGRLVKSCVLPGVPKPVVGDVILSDAGGFSGSICNLHTYTSMLTPDAAAAFFAAGTTCGSPAQKVDGVDKDSAFITLFGYTFRFSTLDRMGRELSSYTL
jgi:hypothetical protein